MTKLTLTIILVLCAACVCSACAILVSLIRTAARESDEAEARLAVSHQKDRESHESCRNLAHVVGRFETGAFTCPHADHRMKVTVLSAQDSTGVVSCECTP